MFSHIYMRVMDVLFTGVKGEGSTNEPSASLVRAVLLAGAEPMTGIAER